MKQRFFYILLISIALFGLFLRLHDYDRLPPFGETRDEFFYPWAGMSLLKTGVPTSWSPFGGYTLEQKVKLWGVDFRLVSPWLEKPPLYPLLTGGLSLLAGQDEFGEVRLSTIRLVPILLNTVTIFLIGLLGARLFDRSVGLVASLLYATIPTIVMANRLSVTENLLIPVVLFTLWVYLAEKKRLWHSFVVGIGCAAALLTKQIGVVLPVSILILEFYRKNYRSLLIIGGLTFLGGIIHPLMALYYNSWELYTSLLKQYQDAHALGVPQAIANLFLHPGVGHKEKIFVDGSLLAGYILLFSAPLWLRKDANFKRSAFLAFPFGYLVLFTLLVGNRTWYGWHLFPLFPFLALLLAKVFLDLWRDPDLYRYLALFVIVGFSSARFLILLNFPQFETRWPIPMGFILGISLVAWFVKSKRFPLHRWFLGGIFAAYVAINVYTVVSLEKIYSAIPQPRSSFDQPTSQEIGIQ